MKSFIAIFLCLCLGLCNSLPANKVILLKVFTGGPGDFGALPFHAAHGNYPGFNGGFPGNYGPGGYGRYNGYPIGYGGGYPSGYGSGYGDVSVHATASARSFGHGFGYTK